MRKIETDVLVIGSGAGAAGLVPELVKKNKTVTVVEQAEKNPDLGKGLDERGKRIFKPKGQFPQSREGVIFYHHHGLGGTLEISCANAIAPTDMDLSVLGIPIGNEVDETMEDMGVEPFPETHLGKNASLMMESARTNGYPMQPMPKFIDFDQCTACAMCELICPNRAKWSSRRVLESLSRQNKIDLRDGIAIDRLLMDGSTAVGALGSSKDGPVPIRADTVVLAAGAVGTPAILQRSGIDAGSNFFLDLFVVVYGKSARFSAGREIPMPAFYHSPDEAFVISPYLDVELWFILTMRKASKWLNGKNMDGLMVKIKDEQGGRVNPDGSVNKITTSGDKATMQRGVDIAEKILTGCGAKGSSITVTSPRGAHPGGTAAIGTVVDKDLKVIKTNNVYVADASVLPRSPGKPPIITIMALAKMLGKTL